MGSSPFTRTRGQPHPRLSFFHSHNPLKIHPIPQKTKVTEYRIHKKLTMTTFVIPASQKWRARSRMSLWVKRWRVINWYSINYRSLPGLALNIRLKKASHWDFHGSPAYSLNQCLEIQFERKTCCRLRISLHTCRSVREIRFNLKIEGCPLRPKILIVHIFHFRDVDSIANTPYIQSQTSRKRSQSQTAHLSCAIIVNVRIG